MASIKISGLTEQTTASDTDLLPVASSAGMAKRMTLANFVTWLTSKLNSKFAPAGFGLGEPIGLIGTTESNLHDVVDNFLSTKAQVGKTYFVNFGIEGAYFIYGTLTVGGDKNYCVLMGRPYSSPSALCQITKENGIWHPLEWFNPPMLVGVEYRTVERWNGNAVYTMLVDFGALPNNNNKVKTITVQAGGTVIEVIDVAGDFKEINGVASGGLLGFDAIKSHWATCTSTTIALGFEANTDASAYNAWPVIKYTKD